jgi:hypothetical protein
MQNLRVELLLLLSDEDVVGCVVESNSAGCIHRLCLLQFHFFREDARLVVSVVVVGRLLIVRTLLKSLVDAHSTPTFELLLPSFSWARKQSDFFVLIAFFRFDVEGLVVKTDLLISQGHLATEMVPTRAVLANGTIAKAAFQVLTLQASLRH